MSKKLEEIMANMKRYDEESQDFLKSISASESQINKLSAMRATEGWKILEQKIREELQERINDLVKYDLKIQTLLALLKVADTRSLTKILDEEIDNLIPA